MVASIFSLPHPPSPGTGTNFLVFLFYRIIPGCSFSLSARCGCWKNEQQHHQSNELDFGFDFFSFLHVIFARITKKQLQIDCV